MFSHKDPSLCLTCRRCIPNAFLQPTPHRRTIASLLSFSCLVSVNSTLLTTESVLTPEEFKKLNDIRTARDFQGASHPKASYFLNCGLVLLFLFCFCFKGNLQKCSYSANPSSAQRAALNAAPLIALKCKYMDDFLSLTIPEQPFPLI